ncbi:MAG TPA: sigma-54 dependent transcriptional regulator [Planctomycetota bacterium]
MSTILIAEDEGVIRKELSQVFSDKGYKVIQSADGALALSELKKQSIQLVITELRIPGLSGLELVRKGREQSPESEFIVMTASASMDTAIEAMRAGASDYLVKPLAMDELLAKVDRIMENAELRARNRMLSRDLDRKWGPLEMVGQSPSLQRIREMIRKVAPTRSPVLISGESGTGKELIARAIHSLSAAKGEPFVPVNCAAIPENLLESELFGHQKGSFTGAIGDTEGLFRSARKGTLFLDEISELPMSLQAKLLRVLEDKMIHPVGSTRQIPFEARVVAASNRNLKHEIARKAFREDLYFRLAVMELHSPPLRERREDIVLLTNHLIRRLNRELNRSYTGADDTAMQRLVSGTWVGNIRELQNTIERAMIVGSEPLIREDDLSPSSHGEVPSIASTNLKEAVHAFEQSHVRQVISQCAGDKRRAARELGISLSSLYRYIGN